MHAAYTFLRLRTAYGLILALRTAYRLTTKTTFFGVFIYMKIKIQFVARAGTLIFNFVSFVVFA